MNQPVAGLNYRQHQLLAFIQNYVSRNTVSPSYEEMAAGLGIRSKSSVLRILAALETKGYLARRSNMARSVSLLAEAPAPPPVPVPPPAPRRFQAKQKSAGVYEIRINGALDRVLRDLCIETHLTPADIISTALADYILEPSLMAQPFG